MIKASLDDLQKAINGVGEGPRTTAGVTFAGVSTDSRYIAPGNLFVALRGERFDAHDFLEQVAAQGAAAVVAERVPEGLNIPALLVPDTRVALGEIAAWWRSKFTIPVIGVTGSNGKTTVKEMIASILAEAYGADGYLATRGNLNNEIGVPLTVLRLGQQCKAAVIELAMNHPGEIAVLAKIARPTLAMVNNAQREHQEFMSSVAAVAEENGSVLLNLADDGVAVFPGDEEFTPLWRGYAGKRKTATFGLTNDANVHGAYHLTEFGSELTITHSDGKFTVNLAAAGLHNVRNALAAAACTLGIGLPAATVARGLEAFAPVAGRLQRKTSSIGSLVIDDTYNANPDSVRAAIDVLATLPAPRLLVLGDMGEVGDAGPQFHEEVGAYAHQRGIDGLMTLGTLAQHSSRAFGAGATHYEEIEGLKQALDHGLTKQTAALVKGSRFMKMERVVQHLLGKTESNQGSH
ncbi:MAG: UDP-N-acetylmuramoyl-tripeptide--D-alanyl-D-alanine ligase [Burkholderiaceae bacterium]|nr:UDP-N-acetylmuramoyl-tripeptide--D-alanyl-D-alanine ligase [Burkholderiaceae bacterium]